MLKISKFSGNFKYARAYLRIGSYAPDEESKKSLQTFGNGKLPGEDGFTVEFHKHFFDLVGADLLASLNRAYELGRLSGYRSLSVGA